MFNCILKSVSRKQATSPLFTVHALDVIARIKKMSQLAKHTVLTREGLYKALSPEGNPTFTTVAKVAKALGLQITVQTVQSTKRFLAINSTRPTPLGM